MIFKNYEQKITAWAKQIHYNQQNRPTYTQMKDWSTKEEDDSALSADSLHVLPMNARLWFLIGPTAFIAKTLYLLQENIQEVLNQQAEVLANGVKG